MGMYKSDGTSLYHAYTVSLKYHKEGSDFDASLFYTYSINKDFDSNERNYSGVSIQEVNAPGKDWSYADTDRRSVLTGFISYNERRFSGIMASLAIRYLSGFPYSLSYSKDMNGDGQTSNDRYYEGGIDSGRNSLRSCSNTTLDLALRRDFALYKKVKLTLSADVFNLLNRQDTYVRTTVDGTGTDAAPKLKFGQNYVGSPRQAQLGVRLSF